ncbi:MAG: hypothetical protein ACP5OO_10595 [Chloroflexia bacterium]
MKFKRLGWYGFGLILAGILLAVIAFIAGSHTASSAVGGVLGFGVTLVGFLVVYRANRELRR